MTAWTGKACRWSTVALGILLVAAPLSIVRAEQQADSVLGVESVSGTATVDHLGARKNLQPGDRLNERDVIRTGADGRLSLRFARLGFFELGPNAEIGVEKLPFASYADDLKSIFSLSHGYLRVVWKHLSTSASWPLYVYFGGQRAGLAAGEYFFDQRESATRICIAAGQIAVVPVTGEAVETLRPPSCTRLFTGVAPDNQPRDPEDWIAVRREFSIDATTHPDDGAPATTANLPPDRSVVAATLPPRMVPPAPIVVASPPVAVPPTLPSPPARRSTTPAAVAAAAAGTAASSAVPAASPPSVAPVPPVAIAATPPAEAAPPQPVPVVKAASATPAPPAAGVEPGWTINVASYPENDPAARQAQQLSSGGYAATVQPAQIKGQTWYRVQVRGFASADAARAKATELQDKLGYRNLWVVRQP